MVLVKCLVCMRVIFGFKAKGSWMTSDWELRTDVAVTTLARRGHPMACVALFVHFLIWASLGLCSSKLKMIFAIGPTINLMNSTLGAEQLTSWIYFRLKHVCVSVSSWVEEGFAVEPLRHDLGAVLPLNDSGLGPKVRVTDHQKWELQPGRPPESEPNCPEKEPEWGLGVSTENPLRAFLNPPKKLVSFMTAFGAFVQWASRETPENSVRAEKRTCRFTYLKQGREKGHKSKQFMEFVPIRSQAIYLS